MSSIAPPVRCDYISETELWERFHPLHNHILKNEILHPYRVNLLQGLAVDDMFCKEICFRFVEGIFEYLT